ncbi:MAG: insulinase family protein [Calditrichaceae bacterium]|nr:insulinase family protein [Calditrichaceae bacterium]
MKTISSIRTLFGIIVSGLFINLAFADSGFKMPDYETIKLNNGMTVFLLEHHEVPLININVVFMAGSVNDEKKYGLASLTAEALQFGTKSYTKNQIEEIFDYYGASFNIAAGRDAAYLNLTLATKDLDHLVPVFNEIITQPVFDESEFLKRKERLLAELDQDKEIPRQVIRSYFNQFIFGPTGYGIPISGSKSSIEQITNIDVKNFYQKYYSPQTCAMAIVGAFDPKEIKNKIKSLFDKWQNADANNQPVDSQPVKETSRTRVLLINKDDARETTFLIGTPGIKRNNEDFLQIEVINTILGGRFTSWLNDELRVNSGLTYGAGSAFSAYKTSGTFSISSFTATENTIKAIDLALEVLNRLYEKGIDEETLNSAKKYINGQFPPEYETASDLAGLLIDMYIYGYDDNFINTFQSKVDEMTLEDTRKIIKTYFPRENLQFVLIGKKSELADKIGKYGPVTEKEILDDGF